MMEGYAFDFSVVMSVYNMDKYLEEAVDSVLHQTLGIDRIQLILVDDGSKDKSGSICDDYQKRYPDSIEVIHKPNGGLSSARNEGLKHIRGKYVTFTDPDDYLDPDVMEKVFAFMESKGNKADVCCIPMQLFGDHTGPHTLNGKFGQGSRVIDLSEEGNSQYILLHACSSFYREAAARTMEFDTVIYTAEDAKENLRLLLGNPNLGVVSDTVYHYRRHGDTIISKSTRQKRWYTVYLERFSKWILELAEEKKGSVPEYIQQAVMYDLQWKLQQENIPEGVLEEQEIREYKELLWDVLSKIDDDVILSQKKLGLERKYYTLYRKHGCPPESPSDAEMRTVWEFLKVDREQNTCTLEGYHLVCCPEGSQVFPFLLVDRKVVPCETVKRKKKVLKLLGEPICRAVGFRAVIPLGKKTVSVAAGVSVDGKQTLRKKCSFGDLFPVIATYRYAYALPGGRFVCQKEGRLRIASAPSLPVLAVREVRWLMEIWKKNYTGGRKAVIGRLGHHLLRPLKRRKLWIISDRIMQADDNGEALFRYLRKNPPENTDVVFALNKESSDWERIRKIGPCVSAMSFRHKFLHLFSDINISSQADAMMLNPYYGHDGALRDLLTHQRFVFLQHGITKDDLSGWINRYNKDMSGIVTAAARERDSFLEGDYGYPEDRIWLTGFPRFDRLYRDEKNWITVMPTWRKKLMSGIDSETGVWTAKEGFEKSEYFRFYNSLLNSEKLLSALEKKGYRLQFFPHPNMKRYMDRFQRDRRVGFLPADTSYRDVYASSSLVVTDYSSAVFDFAYLRKPVVYCQFDKEDFFAGEHAYTKGYFDYERDGFGEVAGSLEETIGLIISYAEEGCQLKEEYRERIDSFFAFNDSDSCRRVTEKLLALR